MPFLLQLIDEENNIKNQLIFHLISHENIELLERKRGWILGTCLYLGQILMSSLYKSNVVFVC